MTTTKTTTTCAITRRDGALLWSSTEAGPRGGRVTMYAPRRAGETKPSAWVIWSWRQRDVDVLDVVIAHDLAVCS